MKVYLVFEQTTFVDEDLEVQEVLDLHCVCSSREKAQQYIDTTKLMSHNEDISFVIEVHEVE